MTSVQNYTVGNHYPITPDYDDCDPDYCCGSGCASGHVFDHGVVYPHQQNGSYNGSAAAGTASSYDQKSDYQPHYTRSFGPDSQIQYQQFETANYYQQGAAAVAPQAESHQQAVQQQQPEEKPTGGISAHIEYEMDVMARFVTLCAYGIFSYADTLTKDKAKRSYVDSLGGVDKFSVSKSVAPFVLSGMRDRPGKQFATVSAKVLAVLQSTRLPHESILCGIYYLSERVGKLRVESRELRDEMVYPFIVTALLLGSKFIDDNTFHNRSWADVSGLKLAELNMIEAEWLFSVNFCLFPLGDKFKDASAWHQLFISYEHIVEGHDLRAESWPQTPASPVDRVYRPVVNTTSPASSASGRSYYGGSTAMLTPPHSASSESRLSSSIWSTNASSVSGQDGGWSSISSQQNSSVASPASSEHGPTTPPYVEHYAKNNSLQNSWAGSTDSFHSHYSHNPYHQTQPVDVRSYQFDGLPMQTGLCGQMAYPSSHYGPPVNHFLPQAMVSAAHW